MVRDQIPTSAVLGGLGIDSCITAMWFCFSCVLVHSNKCVEQTVLPLTYTNNSVAKNSRFGGGRGQGFRISTSVVCIAFTFLFVLV